MKDIVNQLNTLEKDMKLWSAKLNEKGIWLYLGTLGCLGIPEELLNLQIFAFSIILFLFFWYLIPYQKLENMTFPARLEEIHKLIQDEKENTIYLELVNRYQYIKKMNRSVYSVIPYVLGLLFWFFAFIHFFELWLTSLF